ncbi:MAG: response regulator [Candidatus Lokiarchaeota archaeon]|nr:response regulator [Candidatus Lokiarchaeota archaeon]MBD3202288.1 response regulator [Candidatus Lokiarchaeota archaeon]
MPRVFIVEDDKSIQTLYKKFLNLYGFDVIDTASNGEEAVEKFKNFEIKPDIILMDHRMPVKDGIQATREILELKKNCNIIFASADKTIKEQALSMGILGFLEKPFSLEKLISQIKRSIPQENLA